MADDFTTVRIPQLAEVADLEMTDLLLIQRGDGPAQTAPVQAVLDAIETGIDEATEVALTDIAAEGASQIANVGQVFGAKDYPTNAKALSNGVASVAIGAAGTGGTPGTYAWTTTGGGGTNASGYLVVGSGGTITEVVVQERGYDYTSAPTIVIAGSHGVTGHTLTPALAINRPVGAFWRLKVSDGFELFENVAGVATSRGVYPTLVALNAMLATITDKAARLTLGLAPLYDLVRTDDAEVFSRGDHSIVTPAPTLNAALKGWRAPIKHNGKRFQVVEFAVRAQAADTLMLVRILDSGLSEIARGYRRVGTTAAVVPTVLASEVSSLAAAAIGYIEYSPAEAGGVLSYPVNSGVNNYPVGDADPSVYREQFLSAANVWTNAGPAGQYCIQFRALDYADVIAKGAFGSLQAEIAALNAVIASGSVIVWENPGFTGYDSFYSQAGVGTQTPTLATAVTFNNVTVYGGCPGEGELRGYIVDPATSLTHAPDPTDTLLFTVDIDWDAAVAKRVVELGDAYTVPAGKRLHTLWVSKTPGQNVSAARFTVDPGAAAPAVRLATTGAGVPATAFAASWSNGTREYCTVPPLLSLALPGQAAAEEDEDAPFFTIPAVVNAVVGVELNLYHDAIFSGRADVGGLIGHSVEVTGPKGQNKQRGFRFTPASGDVGTHAFVATARDATGKVVATRAFNIVVQAATAKGSAKNVAMAGDSLHAADVITPTVQARFAALGPTIPSFVGPQGGIGGLKLVSFSVSGVTAAALGTTFTQAYVFTVSGVAVPPGAGSTWTVGGVTYTVVASSITADSGTVAATGASAPPASGTLTKASGTGDATITYSALAGGGATYTVQAVHLSGGSGWLICSTGVAAAAPLASGILTKTGTGTGDATIAFSASATLPTAKYAGLGGKTFAFYATAGGTAYRFTVSGVTSAVQGATYTVGGVTYTIVEVNLTGGAGTIAATGASAPPASGTLTKASGSGDATIAFSASATEGGNPFWNAGALDVANFRTVQGVTGLLDVVTQQLGVNDVGITGTGAVAAMIANAKLFADAQLADNPDCIVGIALPTLCGATHDGFAANYGAAGNRAAYEAAIFALRKAILEAFDGGAYHANVKVGSAGLQVDRVHGYGMSTVPAASRIPTTVSEHINAVHPGTVGYYQNGDAMFADIMAWLG